MQERMISPARPASEPEASQAARLRRRGHDRRAWLNAVYVPRRWSLRRRVERGSDARPAVVGFGWPAVIRPRLRDACQCARLGQSRSVTLDYDVRVADRHRDRTPRIAADIAPLPRACARLEPERAVSPQGTDRSHVRATVLVDGGQPGRAGVRRVRGWRRPRIELLNNCGPVHRRQPIRLTQIGDLHKASFRCPAYILAIGVSQIKTRDDRKVIAHTRVTSRAGAHASAYVHPYSRLGRAEHPVLRSISGRDVDLRAVPDRRLGERCP